MYSLKTISLALSLLAACAMPAFASITVITPGSGTVVAPQFTLSANASSCSGQPVSAMGFSLDSSSNTTVVHSTAIDATVSATTGAHTLHVKAWGNAGAGCVTDVAITVSATAGTSSGVSVTNPGSGATVATPFQLTADALTCSSQPVSAMGYSIDTGNTTIVKATAINASVTAPTGAHTLHVKAWGNQGAACSSDVPLNIVTSTTSTASPTVTTSTTTTATAPLTSNGVTVTSPTNGSTIGTTFTLNAAASTCSSQPVSAMGYSIDYGSTTIVNATSLSRSVTSPTGTHTLHVKAWGNSGSSCVADVSINVSTQTTTTTSSTPSSTSTSTSTTSNGITVSSPVNNATVGSPFALNATAPLCSSQAVSAMGYSLDTSSNTAIVNGTSVAASVTASAGAHTLHVKAWGNGGASCVADIAINVGSSTSTTTSTTTAGGVTISSPSTGASVAAPFNLVASASNCSSQTVTSIGYGLDNATKTIATGSALNTQISAATGTHTVYVTAWGSGGAVCNASVAVDVTNSTSATNSVVPSNAINVSNLQALNTWVAAHDPGAGSSSSGSTNLVNSPSLSGNARQFYTSFSNSSGEIYHVTFGDDTSATNFFYDGWVYLTSSASNVANLEMDMNQVMSNGQTVIYGFQCDGYSGTWDYTENAGSPTSPSDHWVHSSAPCHLQNWTKNAWHHIQISYSRDSSGHVTYHSVWLDGVESPINATVPSAFALGWGPVLITNFQIDGMGSGSDTVYLDKLTISRW